MIKKGFVIISFAFIFLLSMSIVFANDNLNQNEKISFGKWLKGLWGKITGNPIFQRGGEQTPSLAPIENNQNRNLFSRAPSSQIQTPPADFSDKEDKEISLEITKKSEEIKRLNLELVELNDKYSRNQIFFKKRTSNKLDKLAIERKKEMIELAKENPVLFLNNVMSKDKRELFPDEIKKHIEEETLIEGNLLTLHIDDFKDINAPVSKFEYFIITEENKKINFYPIMPQGFIPEAEIKVSGYKIDDNLVGFVREIQIKEEKTSKTILGKVTGKAIQYPYPEIPENPGEHKVAVILVDFLDSSPAPFTPVEAHELIFNGQFQNFYREQSYNQIYFTGDVFGWFTLPRNSQGNCRVGIGWGQELDSYIINNNIDLNNYDSLLILSNAFDCFGGISSVGPLSLSIDNQISDISIAWIFGDGSNFLSPSSWSNNYPPDFSWTNLDFVLSHEMGHSLGVMHANGYDCDEHPYYFNNNYTNCQHREYGNPFDAMGGEGYAFHFNNFYKEIFGWISPQTQEMLTIDKSGTYTINNLETSGGIKGAKIKLLDSKLFQNQETKKFSSTSYYPYYLEYRKGVGFDDNLNNPELTSNQDGLLINYNNHGLTRLLDMDATSSHWYEDLKSASLSGNNIFNDPLTGITIGPIISSTPTNITFNVSLQQTTCIREQPLIIDPKLIFVGDFIIIPFGTFNSDSPICGLSKFNTIAELPLGFSSGDFPLKGELFPLAEEYLIFGIQTSPTLCTGSYPISFSVENLNSGLITTETIYINITGTTLCPQKVALPEF